MFLRNLIFGWRNIRKNGIYSVINMIGLSLALAMVGLILIWVSDELNYDTFHENWLAGKACAQQPASR